MGVVVQLCSCSGYHNPSSWFRLSLFIQYDRSWGFVRPHSKVSVREEWYGSWRYSRYLGEMSGTKALSYLVVNISRKYQLSTGRRMKDFEDLFFPKRVVPADSVPDNAFRCGAAYEVFERTPTITLAGYWVILLAQFPIPCHLLFFMHACCCFSLYCHRTSQSRTSQIAMTMLTMSTKLTRINFFFQAKVWYEPSSHTRAEFALQTANTCLELYEKYFRTRYPLPKLGTDVAAARLKGSPL